ncbi:nucleotide exchange factor GrpE [Candidatus Gracilibacteria bacterium]|nr:nucleotide exchange factor GrpE [Candidatus Gracilibacteria bacterium]MCF7819079.1 nucleotide exchange factor GrpE [Candidatus Gracilibacteria bacterium]
MTAPQEEKNKKQPSADNSGGNQKTDRELDSLREELKKAQSAHMRALADLQNFQRRESENKSMWVQGGVAEFLKNLAPRLLELRLSSAHAKDKDVAQTINGFFVHLEKMGLRLIEPKKGEDLNPDLHEVILAEKGMPGKVVRTLEPGWKYQDVVLRPAKVSAAQTQ